MALIAKTASSVSTAFKSDAFVVARLTEPQARL